MLIYSTESEDYKLLKKRYEERLNIFIRKCFSTTEFRENNLICKVCELKEYCSLENKIKLFRLPKRKKTKNMYQERIRL